MKKGNANSGNVKSLKRALNILRCFTKEAPYMSLSSISEATGLPFTTTTRIVNTLHDEGFLMREEGSRMYYLGYILTFLGDVAHETMDLKKIVIPYMEKLRNHYKQSVNIFVRSGNSRICYAQLESPQVLRHAANLGEDYPLWAGAAGKCFLAFGNSMDVEKAFQSIKPLTANTVTDREAFLKQLEETRRKGHIITQGERAEGVTSIASPVFGPDGKICAVMTVAGPSLQFSTEIITEIVPDLLASTSEISRKLGAPEESLKFDL